jgi:hypothetical protein
VVKKIVKKKRAKKAVVKIRRVAKAKKGGVTKWEKKMAVLRKASTAKIKELELELIRLREENEYKNRRLASRDIEFETYRKTMETKIFQLQAKVKELEG